MKNPLIVLAPGAGAPSSSDWMRAWAARLGTLGKVVPFDYDYQIQGRRRPDLLPALIARHRQAIAEARASQPGPLVLAGKSMGSRVGCHVSLEEPVDALVCFGYPLQAVGTGKLRDQVLLQLKTPVLFLQGTKDKLCPLPLLEAVRERMSAKNPLHIVDGGDHSLRISKRLPQEPVDAEMLEVVRNFLEFDLIAAAWRQPASTDAPRGLEPLDDRRYPCCTMCRNIRVLYNFDPPTTPDEVRAAALQYVRKVSGVAKPSHADEKAFERAVESIANATDRLLTSITAHTATRTREGEREKARARWEQRAPRLRPG